MNSYHGYGADKLLGFEQDSLIAKYNGKGSQIKDRRSETSATRKVLGKVEYPVAS